MQHKKSLWITTLLGAAVVVLVSGYIGGQTKAQQTLYDRIGGGDALVLVVDEFVANIAADDRINERFANTDLDNLKRLLVEQVCELAGGPCTYTGRSMTESHGGLGISGEEFDAIVEDLEDALDEFNIADQEKGEILGPLGGLRGQIVSAN